MGREWLGLLTVAFLVLAFVPAEASADHAFCPAGSGAGQCDGAQGVATDFETGHVYVADNGNNRVDAFEEDGDFLRAFGWDVAPEGAPGDTASNQLEVCTTVCQAGSTGAGAGQFASAVRVAVDNDPASVNHHDVYVYDSRRVQRFTPAGEFVLAFGWDVVGFGPNDSGNDEQQQITVKATGGSFRLKLENTFSGGETQETAALAHNASAAQVEAALEALSTIGGLGGSVTVSGGPGNATGSSPYLVSFEGNLGGDDIPTLGTVNDLTGSAPSISIKTPVPGGAYEVCVDAAGELCKPGTGGDGEGFGSGRGLGVGPAGVIFVIDTKNEGECPIAGDGGGEIAKRVQKFDPADPAGPVEPPINLVDAPCGEVQGFAVDSTGAFYVANGAGSGAVRKYEVNGTPLAAPYPINASFNISALAVDADDNLFVADLTDFVGSAGERPRAIHMYDSSGTQQRAFGYGQKIVSAPGIAAHATVGQGVFASRGSEATSKIVHLALPPAGPFILSDPRWTRVDPIGNTKATLNAAINPEGKASKYRFQYVKHETFTSSGFASATSTPEFDFGSTADFKVHLVSAQIGCQTPTNPPQASCLTPDTLYHFRVLASNADGAGNSPVEGEFETRPHFEILATWAREVGTDTARIHAEVNPLGIEASGHLEYVEEAKYQEDLKGGGDGFAGAAQTPEVSFGSGEAPTIRSAQLGSLKPGTTYRYRVLVENVFGFKESGPVHAFTTFRLPGEVTDCPNEALRIGPSGSLPDCRAYEMVSPLEKGNDDIKALGFSELARGDLNQSALGGGKLTYSASRSFGDAQSAPFTSQYIATREQAAEEWRSEGISPPRTGPLIYDTAGFDSQFKAFSENLQLAWLRTDSEPPLTEDAIAGYPGLYRRDNAADAYQALCPVEPPNLAPGAYLPQLQGFSTDGSVTVFQAEDKLTAEASSKKGLPQVYGCAGSELRLVSVLPSEAANGTNSSVGTGQSVKNPDHRLDSVHNAVSEDGSRVYWRAAIPTGVETEDQRRGPTNGPGKIYLRENPFGEGANCSGGEAPCTRKVSELVSPGAAQFWTASPDGSKAIFSIAGNLYEFDAEAEASPARLVAEGVSGLAGWSEDASRLYLLSTKALAPGAVADEPNLYLYEAGDGSGSFDLVATLPDVDAAHIRCYVDAPIPANHCTRATSDGRQLAFMTTTPLTDYDNADAASGQPDAEVYLYDSSAPSGEEKLRCVSCNPSGGRPAGRALIRGAVVNWIAAQIPAWTNSFYASRALSADGRRLFFESFDALVLEDTNGKADVYEWERAGKGDCTTESSTFVLSAGGCVDLISSGESAQDSQFVDASADGTDVFFKTEASLWPPDSGLIDIYDARAGGGFVPPDPPVPPCEGEACQSPPAPPPEITPASAAFEGAGNQVNSKPRCSKGKRRVVRKGKPRCVRKNKGVSQKQRRRGR